MSRRVFDELLHLAAGLAAAIVLTRAAMWAYPPGRPDIAWCGAAAFVATLVTGLEPVARAWREVRP